MRRWAALLAVLAALPATEAGARVAFTGYADAQFRAHEVTTIEGPPGVLADLGVAPGRDEEREFRAEAVGIFAATKLAEPLSFLMDITFRRIGFTAGETRLQYAFLEYVPSDDWTARLGKVTLPFGYYNEHRFYPFQRHSVTGPIFHEIILGLPISDIGASAAKRFSSPAWEAELVVYAVNGYGSIPTSTASFREPSRLGLALTGNIERGNNNDKLSYGTRLALSRIGGRELGGGFSYYRGEWDPAGRNLFQMYNLYATAGLGDLKFILELLRLDVDGDPGFAQAVGSPDWTTDGGFLKAWLPVARVLGKPLVAFFLGEHYETRGRDGGSKEILRSYAGGASLQVHESLLLKAQYRRLDYTLPFFGQGDVHLDQDDIRLAAVVTF